MNSSDVIIVIGGQEYAIGGNTLRPTESTFQSEVLRRLDNLEQEQKYQREALQIIGTQQQVLIQRVDDLSTFIYWILGAIGLFLAAITILPAITAMVQTFLEIFKSKSRESLNEDALIERIIERLNQKHVV